MPQTRSTKQEKAANLELLFGFVVRLAKPVWSQDVEAVSKEFGWKNSRSQALLSELADTQRIFRKLLRWSNGPGRGARQQHEVHTHEGPSKTFVDEMRRRCFEPSRGAVFGDAVYYQWPQGLDRDGCPLCLVELEALRNDPYGR